MNVTVSAGTETHVVPDVTPYQIKEATRQLEALKFVVQPVKVSTSPLRLGRVTHTDPAAGTTQPVGTVIKVYYSAGFVEVPNVVGKSAGQRRRALLTNARHSSRWLVVPSRPTPHRAR